MSFEAEQATLGSMILDNDCISLVSEILFTDMFQDATHRLAFEGMVRLNNAGTPIDAVQVRNLGIPTETARQIAESVPHAASAEYYAKIVLETYKVVQLNKLSDGIRSITTESILPDEMISKVQQLVTERTSHEDLRVIDSVGDIAKTLSFKINGSKRIPTGFKNIDNIIIGVSKADFIIIAGRPSMGKTSLMLDIAVNMSWENGFPTAFYSCEMLPEQLTSRIASARAGISLYKVEKGYAKPEEIELLEEAARQMKDVPIYIKGTSGLTPSALKRKILSDKRKYGIKVAFVDHLHLMYPDGQSGKEYENLTNISKAFKSIIIQTGIPIILGCQLRRTEESKRPTMKDLRGSGAIEQDGDVIIGIHRPSYYTPDEPDPESEAIVLKGKHFGMGKADLLFDGSLTHFRDKPWT